MHDFYAVISTLFPHPKCSPPPPLGEGGKKQECVKRIKGNYDPLGGRRYVPHSPSPLGMGDGGSVASLGTKSKVPIPRPLWGIGDCVPWPLGGSAPSPKGKEAGMTYKCSQEKEDFSPFPVPFGEWGLGTMSVTNPINERTSEVPIPQRGRGRVMETRSKASWKEIR